MEWLEKLDKDIFLFLNGFHTSVFDHLFSLTNLVITWVPLYALFIYLFIKKFKRKSWIPMLFAAFLVVATDQSSVLIKNSVKRYRPSHDAEMQGKVHLINNEKGGQFGFVSSHAANIWGISFFIIPLLGINDKKWILLIIFWATLVSYGRIYSGVHYPIDVFGGALLGVFFARISVIIIKKAGIISLTDQLIKTE